jgi:hypothetical protein
MIHQAFRSACPKQEDERPAQSYKSTTGTHGTGPEEEGMPTYISLIKFTEKGVADAKHGHNTSMRRPAAAPLALADSTP